MKQNLIFSSIRLFLFGIALIAIAIFWWINILPQQAQDPELTLKGHGFVTQLQRGLSYIVGLVALGLTLFYLGVKKLSNK